MLNVSKLRFSHIIVKPHISAYLDARAKEHVALSILCLEVLHVFEAVLECSCNEHKSSYRSKDERGYLDEVPVSNYSYLVDLVGSRANEVNEEPFVLILTLWRVLKKHGSLVYN